MANRPTMTTQNAALRDQLTPTNREYWDQLVVLLAQQPHHTSDAQLHDLLTGLLVAQERQEDASQFFGGTPAEAVRTLTATLWPRPWWLTSDLWFPFILFTIGIILPTAILPAVPLQASLMAVQYGLLVIALGLGIWLAPKFSPRGRLVSWGLIIVVLLAVLSVAARWVPAAGLFYLTRKGGSVFLLVFAVALTALIVVVQRRQPESWLPALTADVWITTLLALMARIAPTSSLMVTAMGNLIIALGTILGDLSILIIGWHIWQTRQAHQQNKE